MIVRPPVPEDYPAIALLQAASWRDSYRGILPEDYLETQVTDDLLSHWNAIEIRPRDIVLVAEDDGIVGFIAVWCRPDPFIENLHVLPNKRSGGVGTELMVAAAEDLLRHDLTTAYLWVLVENRRAVRFYRRLGGVVVEEAIKPVFGHDLPNYKIAWPDLSEIAVRQGIRQR